MFYIRQRGVGTMAMELSGLTSGVMNPDEFSLVQEVYDTISSETWFVSSPAKRQQFAAYVLSVYRRGVSDPTRLWSQCRAAAAVQFVEPGHNPD